MVKLFADYATFTKRTLDGSRGKTAQFCMEYIERVHLHQLVDRAIRESDIDLYICSLTEIIDLFFATNRVNYVRWISKHQLDLIHLPSTHPGLKKQLAAGLFSVRRTDNDFCRLPVDLTLEQTVNADAASRTTGYTNATNNYNARLRWSVTKSNRAAIICATLDLVGMTTKHDVHSQLKDSRIKRDASDLKKVIKAIKDNVDPFSMETEQLVNIHTGKCATLEISDSLLNIKKVGKEKHDAFVEECHMDSSRFEKKISQNKLKTFVNQGAQNRKAQNPVVRELKCTRDILGRIAILATTRDVDLEYLLTFPLTSVPLSICRPDGTMVHTDKSSLFSILEAKVEKHVEPEKITTHIIDGNFLLHCLPPNIPPTYSGLARVMLHMVLSYTSKRVDVVFDTYEEPSIKGCERDRRGAEDTAYIISGPEQLRPKDIKKALKSTSFKQQLPRFFMTEWSSQHYAPALTDRELYLGVDGVCAKYDVVNGLVEKQLIDGLNCNHPEADTRVCFHMMDAERETPNGEIVIRASDTDILVILLHHVGKVTSAIWMEVGTSGRGNRRYVNISAIAEDIGPDMCAALPGCHAYTGCDYTAAFARKGKQRPYVLLGRDPKFPQAFAELASGPVMESTVHVIEEYTCVIYGAKKLVPLNDYRYRVFERAYRPTDKKKPLAKLKGIDGTAIPPCKDVVKHKIDRTRFVASVWHSASAPAVPKTPESGWELTNEAYDNSDSDLE